MEEIEVKLLEIDPVEMETKLLALGAKKIFDDVFEEWLFDREEWASFRGRVRVRKTNTGVFLAYKETTKDSSKGNLEIEFEVPSAETAISFVEKIGIPFARHQQKRRVHYEIGKLSVDVDFWPKIPPYVEIEGETLDEIEDLVKKLELKNKRTELDARQIYKDVYGIDISEIKELVF
jgi:adenylate cyclase class 2